jgi:hypothetical protein
MQQARTLHILCYVNLTSNIVILYGQVTLCNVHRFKEASLYLLLTHCWLVLVFALKIDVASFSETLENFYHITWYHIPEDSKHSSNSNLYDQHQKPCGKCLFCKKHVHHNINCEFTLPVQHTVADIRLLKF